MSMKASIHRDSLGNITVHMEGGLDYENTAPLKKELEGLIVDNPNSQITIDMNALDFVGSSGISVFIDTLKALNKNRDLVKLSNVKTEFIKVFKLYGIDALEALIWDFDNDDTENLGKRAGKKRTFQN